MSLNQSEPAAPPPPLVPADVSKGLLQKLIVPMQGSFKTNWTLSSLRAALLQQRQGNLGQSSLLFDSLLEDDELNGALHRRVNATLEAPFCFKSYEKGEQLTKREQKIEKLFCEMVPDDELFDMIASWLMLGVGIGTIDWDFSSALWMPRLRALSPEFLRWDDSIQRWRYMAADQPELIVEPGNGKWVLFTSGQRGWMWGLLRAIALTWLGKQMAYCDWQRYSQKHGLPIFRAKIPIWRDEDEKKRFVEDLGGLVAEGVIGLPQDENAAGQTTGYDVDLLEATTVSWQGFQASLERADRKFQIMLTGGNLGTEVTKANSSGAAETHSGSLAKLAGSDQKKVGRMLRQQFLAPFFSLNYGLPAAEVPTPYWHANPEYDARSWASAQAQLAATVKTLAEAGVKISNLAEVGRAYHLELAQAVEVEKIAAPPKPAGEGGAKPGAGPGGKSRAKSSASAGGKKKK